MSKAQRPNKEAKKPAQHTAKEKKAAKREKKQSSVHSAFAGKGH